MIQFEVGKYYSFGDITEKRHLDDYKNLIRVVSRTNETVCCEIIDTLSKEVIGTREYCVSVCRRPNNSPLGGYDIESVPFAWDGFYADKEQDLDTFCAELKEYAETDVAKAGGIQRVKERNDLEKTLKVMGITQDQLTKVLKGFVYRTGWEEIALPLWLLDEIGYFQDSD